VCLEKTEWLWRVSSASTRICSQRNQPAYEHSQCRFFYFLSTPPVRLHRISHPPSVRTSPVQPRPDTQRPRPLQPPVRHDEAMTPSTVARICERERRVIPTPPRPSPLHRSSREAGGGFWTRIDRLRVPRLRYRDFRMTRRARRHRARNGLMTSRRQPWEDMKCGASERGADCN